MAVIDKGEDAISDYKCDNETLQKLIIYLNETLQMIENFTKQRKLEQPSFTINDMKNCENEILVKIPEFKRSSKKNF